LFFRREKTRCYGGIECIPYKPGKTEATSVMVCAEEYIWTWEFGKLLVPLVTKGDKEKLVITETVLLWAHLKTFPQLLCALVRSYD
jgi:hypothetical protein